MPDYRTRRATLGDLDALVHHRIAMFTDMGIAVDAPALDAAFRAWLHATMPGGEYVAWVTETATGEIVAGGGISLLRWPAGRRPAPAGLVRAHGAHAPDASRVVRRTGIHALALTGPRRARAESMGYRRAQPDDVQNAVARTAGAGETPGFPIGS